MKTGMRRAILSTAAVVGLGWALKISLLPGPQAIKTERLPSPDGQWVAIVEEVDNVAGFGLGYLNDEVHLVRRNRFTGKHGEDEETVIFYADAMGGSGGTPRLKWRDASHLTITYEPAKIEAGRPQKMLDHREGVTIETVAAPTR